MIAQEDSNAVLREATDLGRSEHRARVSDKLGSAVDDDGRKTGKVAQLVVVTDVHACKILRLNLSRMPNGARLLIASMVASIMGKTRT